MKPSLGGPGVACSAMRIRRLASGELGGEERARAEAHLRGCARCQEVERETGRERARLAVELPFEDFASGVAERLARAPERPRARARRTVGLALAAGLALSLAVPWILRVADRGAGDRAGYRLKGGAEMAVYVAAPEGARALRPDEKVPPGAALRIGLSPGARRFAAVAWMDSDGVAILHAGPVKPGVLPGAFEWTGAGEGTLVAVLSDEPVDPRALADRLRRAGVGAASPGPGVEVVVRPLRRAPP